MATIRPFRAVRPIPELVSKVAALPYDVMTSAEAREMAADNKYSFLHVDKAEIDLDPEINIYDAAVYEKAKENLNSMIENKVFITEDVSCFYIYSLTMNERCQTGIVSCASIDEYLNGIIKKHELTREDKEQDRIRHVDTCNANTGPIFLAYRNDEEITNKVHEIMKAKSPIYDFKADDGVSHCVYKIDDLETISWLQSKFSEISCLYIADGHHRNASAVKVGLKRREENPNYSGEEEFNYYLSVIFPDNELKIFDYNRVVKDLNGNSVEQLLEKIEEKFVIEKQQNDQPYSPEKTHTFGMYVDGAWYKLTAKESIIKENDPVAALDVSILQKELLEPILSISDPRTDKRIDFVGGIRGLGELEKRVDLNEMKIAFSMYPTSTEELMNIADAGEIMPPKSTWFEPKLRSGLFIHML